MKVSENDTVPNIFYVKALQYKYNLYNNSVFTYRFAFPSCQ